MNAPVDLAPVMLSGSGLDIAAVLRVARDGAPVALSPAARARVVAARAVVDRLARSDQPVYGLNTGLGANAGLRLDEAELEAAQRRFVMARAVGIGPRLPREIVRAMMLARAAGLATGGGGISPAVLDALIAALNAGLHPQVPSKGSVGIADLPSLAHVALGLLGLGEAEHEGAILPAAEALRRAGLAPVALAAKDGLTLISANALSVGHGALVVADARAALDALTIAAALSLEGFRANLAPFEARVLAARPAPGQDAIAQRIRALLAGSALWEAGAARRLQDPLSFRCVAQVHGAAAWALDQARAMVETELNAAGDSPLVLAEAGTMASTGNFHVAGLTLAYEALGQGLCQAATLAAGRVIRMMSPPFSGLPLQLVQPGGGRTGLGAVQKTATSLAAEIRHLANPASLDVLPTAEGAEDHATMAPRVVEKSGEIVRLLRAIAAAELIVAAQAVGLRGTLRLGRGAAAVHDAVRAVVPTLDDDRPLGPDIERVEALLASGRLQDVVGVG